jgi:putative transposase
LAKEIKCNVTDINGEEEHIHLILETPPTVCLSAVVAKLKSKSASATLDKFGSFFWGKHSRTLWSGGYFIASTGGVTLEVLKKYLDNQGRA